MTNANRIGNLDYLPPRIKAHKDVLINIVTPPICTERAVAYTKVYKENEHQPVVVRRALALAEHLDTKTIWIQNDELIVGNQGSKLRAAPIFPEYTVDWVEAEIDELADRPGAGFAVTQEDKETLHEVCPYWRGKTVKDRSYAMFSDEHKSMMASMLIKAEGNMNAGDAHLAVNNELILELGIDGVLAKVAERRSRLDLSDFHDLKKEQFLKAVDISMRAYSRYIDRYAEVAEQMAAEETRAERKAELQQMAANCRHIAHQPPENFWQGLQLLYFVMLVLQIESNGHSVSFGRLDQYLYPLYKKDVLEGDVSREFAMEMLQSCWLKLLEVNKIRSGAHSKSSAGSPMYQNVTIGGQDLDLSGQPFDATNELSYTILESCGALRSTQPNLSVRYFKGMNDEFLQDCLKVIECGFGMPAFNNDEIVIPEFVKMGVKREDAFKYSAIGCIETAVPGKWGYRCTGMSFLNFTRVMLAALEGGKDAASGETFLPAEKALSKGNFNSFDEVMAEWDRQVRFYARKTIEIDTVIDTALEENAHDIICSALVDDCIERGKTLKEGGAEYDWVSGLQVGIANTGNSLEAVRKLVFQDERVGQQELAQALESDFEGVEGEKLRQVLLNFAPKYGNDIEEVDNLLAQAYHSYIDELKNFRNTRYGRGPIGGTYYAGTSSISANVPFGATTTATPDGRKAKTPLAEGASPSSGTDTEGPTAVFNSLARLETDKILGGVLLNQKLSPAAIQSDSDKMKLGMMLRTFFEVHNGWHVQYNIVSRDTLLAAKAEPEKYRDLVVRVAGYSAFFTALSPDAQDDIIARTEHSL